MDVSSNRSTPQTEILELKSHKPRSGSSSFGRTLILSKGKGCHCTVTIGVNWSMTCETQKLIQFGCCTIAMIN